MPLNPCVANPSISPSRKFAFAINALTVIAMTIASTPSPKNPGIAKMNKPFTPVSFWAGWTLAPIVFWWENERPTTAAAVLLILLVADALTGLARAWKCKNLSPLLWQNGLVKIAVYLAALAAVNAFARYLGMEGHALAEYFEAVVYGTMLFRELLSIHENAAAVGLPLLPHSILERFSGYAIHRIDTRKPKRF
jgi:phage-related holin